MEERRAAFRGWTYAPFIARNFLDGLTHSQTSDFRLRIYDGTTPPPRSSTPTPPMGARPAFTRRSTLKIMQREWLLVWESTPAFERAERSTNPLYILIGGLLFTALLALLLIVLTVRRTEHIEQMVGARRFAVPMLVFLVIAAGSFGAVFQAARQESDFVERQCRTRPARSNRCCARARRTRRLAGAHGGALGFRRRHPRALWRATRPITCAAPGLRALEWIDAGYRVRWMEPLAGNERWSGWT